MIGRHHSALARMLDLTVAMMEAPANAMPLVCDELMTTLNAGVAGCYEVQWPSGATRPVTPWPTWTETTPWTSSEIAAHPLVRHAFERRDYIPRTITEVVDDRRWLTAPAYREARQRFGDAQWPFLVPLRRSGHVWRCVAGARAGQDLTAEERLYLRRVQPLLIAVDTRQRQAEMDSGPAEMIGLTRREQAVLTLLTEGLTTASIARRLDISPSTVIKHLDHAYRKLDVHDRLSAVLKAQHLGLLTQG